MSYVAIPVRRLECTWCSEFSPSCMFLLCFSCFTVVQTCDDIRLVSVFNMDWWNMTCKVMCNSLSAVFVTAVCVGGQICC